MTTPLITLDIQKKLDNWRALAASGELTLEQMREAIIVMRQGRLAAQEANASSGASKPRAVKKAIDTDALLEGL